MKAAPCNRHTALTIPRRRSRKSPCWHTESARRRRPSIADAAWPFSGMLRRLKRSYGLQSCVLMWSSSYVDRERHFVRCGAFKSVATLVQCGVPKGSVLGPILFLLYTADLVLLTQRHDLCPHLYADDTQIYGTCEPSATVTLREKVSTCVDDVALWIAATVCNWTLRKPRCCGARPADGTELDMGPFFLTQSNPKIASIKLIRKLRPMCHYLS